jgi:hypothetical protein
MLGQRDQERERDRGDGDRHQRVAAPAQALDPSAWIVMDVDPRVRLHGSLAARRAPILRAVDASKIDEKPAA